MSVPVDPHELARTAAGHGPTAYLLTTGSDGRPRVNQVTPAISGNRISVAAGGSASRNAVDRPAVTVLWPPVDDDGFSLIADGDAAVVGGPGPGAMIEIVVTSAVLHRRSPE